MKEKISITLDKGIIKNMDSFVDGLFIRNRSQAIEILLKNYLDKNKHAVILLGGPEDKLKIGQDYVPLIKIKGVSLIERSIRCLRKNDFKEIHIIARKRILDKIFSLVKNGDHYGVKIKYIEEKGSRGTAETLKLLKKEISTTFIVLFGDIYFDNMKLNDLWNFHIKNNAFVTLPVIGFDKPSIKGEIFMNGNKIVKFDQKPNETSRKEHSYLVWSPILICEPELLQHHGNSLEEDIFPLLAKKNLLNGYISSEKEIHLHTKKDLENINKNPKVK